MSFFVHDMFNASIYWSLSARDVAFSIIELYSFLKNTSSTANDMTSLLIYPSENMNDRH